MRRRLIAFLLVAACGGRAPAPARPTTPDVKQLARDLNEDLVQLGDIAHRLHTDCPGLIAELRPHVARMRAHVDEVNRATADPEVARAFQQEARAYASGKSELTDAIARDLAAAYRACRSEELVELIKQIPHW